MFYGDLITIFMLSESYGFLGYRSNGSKCKVLGGSGLFNSLVFQLGSRFQPSRITGLFGWRVVDGVLVFDFFYNNMVYILGR